VFTESIICVNLVTTSHVVFISISNIVLSSFCVSPKNVKIVNLLISVNVVGLRVANYFLITQQQNQL
jgi:hypothetical protein